MSRNRPRWVVLVLIGLLTLLVASCGSGTSNGADSTAVDSTEAADGDVATTAAQDQEDMLETIQQRGTLRAGIYNFPPYSTLDQGEWAGILADITLMIGEELGVEVEPTVLQPAAYIPSIDSGRVDMIVGISRTDERAAVADFSNPIFYAPDAIAVREDSDIQTVGDVTGTHIGVVRGAWGETLTQILIDNGAFEPAETTTYDTYEAPLHDIDNGRIDANVADVIGINYAVQQNPDLNLRAIYIPPEAAGFEKYDSLYYVVPRNVDNVSFLELVNGLLQGWQEDGTLASVYEDHGLGEYVDALLTGEPGS